MDNTVGRNISRLRQINGMSQKQLADELCCTRQRISQWETGSKKPTDEEISALAELFGIEPKILFTEKEELEEAPPQMQSLLSEVSGEVKKLSQDIEELKDSLDEAAKQRELRIKQIRRARRINRIILVIGIILLIIWIKWLHFVRNTITTGENGEAYVIEGPIHWGPPTDEKEDDYVIEASISLGKSKEL